MQLYFGSTNENVAEQNLYEVDFNPNHGFYFSIEVGSNPGVLDDLILSDTCGRSMPIDLESVPSLIAALERVLELRDKVLNAVELSEYVLSEDTEESFTNAN